MKPVLFMAPIKRDGDLDEFDQCSLCGRATSLLVSFRAIDLLVSTCGTCIQAQQKAYDEMMRRRAALQGQYE